MITSRRCSDEIACSKELCVCWAARPSFWLVCSRSSSSRTTPVRSVPSRLFILVLVLISHDGETMQATLWRAGATGIIRFGSTCWESFRWCAHRRKQTSSANRAPRSGSGRSSFPACSCPWAKSGTGIVSTHTLLLIYSPYAEELPPFSSQGHVHSLRHRNAPLFVGPACGGEESCAGIAEHLHLFGASGARSAGQQEVPHREQRSAGAAYV